MRKTSLLLSAALLAFTGCVERTLTVQTDPPGALVAMNDLEIGRTPVARTFEWHGNYEVIVRKDGYQTLKTQTDIKTPWYEYPPIDLVCELLPFKIQDHQEIAYVLVPEETEPGHAEELRERAQQMKGQLGTSLRPTAATQPAPATRP